jgi:hypothetical protein
MDDQSLWKKELSFGRKPKDQADADESPATDEKPTSLWKKELSLKRNAADAVDGDVVADTPPDETTSDEPEAEEPSAAEPVAVEPEVAEETVWKQEVSFGRKPAHEEAATEPEPVVADATTEVVMPDEETSRGTESEEPVWKREVSFGRKASQEDAVVEGEPGVAAGPADGGGEVGPTHAPESG